MFKKYFNLCFLAIIGSGGLDAQTFEWIDTIGGDLHYDFGYSVAIDQVGNVYSAGSFQGPIDLDPAMPGPELNSNGYRDIFIQKYDGLGNFIWAKGMGSFEVDEARSIAADQCGNVYSTGYFVGTVDFDPGPGVHELVNNGTLPGHSDIFVLKLDTDGNYLWAHKFGGDFKRSEGYSILLDHEDNVYVSGFFRDTIDFDPGPGVFNLIPDGQAGFLLKLDPDGNFIWAKKIDGVSIGKMAFDYAGNLFLTGGFSGSVDLNPDAGTFITNPSPYPGGAFIVKLNAQGNFIWAKTLNGKGQGIGGIGFDPQGNIYLAGSHADTIDLDPGPGTYFPVVDSDPGFLDEFTMKLNPSGNFIWARRIGGKLNEIAYDIEVDKSGNVYTVGSYGYLFEGPELVDFDPGAGSHVIFSTSGEDGFIQKLNTNGNFVWAYKVGSGYYKDEVRDILLDPYNNIILCGNYNSGDFDPGPDDVSLDSGGDGDIFIMKWSQESPQCSGGVSTTMDITTCSSYTLNCQTYTQSGEYHQILDGGNGCQNVLTLNLTITQPDQGISQNGETLTADAEGATYQWLDCDNGLAPIPGADQQSFTASQSGHYAAIISQGSCTDTTDCVFVCLPTFGTLEVSAGNEYTLNGQTYTTSGTYTQTLINSAGCDSILTLYLTINFVEITVIQSENRLQAAATGALYQWVDCNNGFSPVSGETQQTFDPTENGSYAVIVTQNGSSDTSACFLVCLATSTTINASACYEYDLNGQIYTTSGAYTQTLENSAGCDSTITLNLTITHVNAGVTQAGAVLTANAAGALYQWVDCSNGFSPVPGATQQAFSPVQNGSYAVMVTQNGCTETSECFFVCLATSSNLEAAACDAYTLNDQTYTTTGIYIQTLENSAGCDSTITLNLTITHIDAGVAQSGTTLTANAAGALYQWVDCSNGFSPVPGATQQSFTPAHNGHYAVMVTQNGCTETSECFSVCLATSSNLEAAACDAYTLNDQTYTTTGIYTQTLENSAGCDSTITLNLTITHIDADVTQAGAVLTANAAGALYQWVDCSNGFSPVPGADQQIFTPDQDGTYAVVVSQNGCADTSACYSVSVVGIREPEPGSGWHVFPNPTGQNLAVIAPEGAVDGMLVEIRNPFGQRLFSKTAKTGRLDLELPFPAGLYIVLVKCGGHQKAFNVIKVAE